MPSSTAIDSVITAVVSTLKAALTYEVFDGPPTKMPARSVTKFLVIGAESPLTDDQEPVHNAATMTQVWQGLGAKRRAEQLRINCVAVGKSTSVASARSLAKGVIDDVATYLPLHPGSDNTFNALVDEVLDTRVRNVSGGSVVQIQFVISAHANLY